MVMGFEVFKEAFKGYEDCYTIIGGTACDILMGNIDADGKVRKRFTFIVLLNHKLQVIRL